MKRYCLLFIFIFFLTRVYSQSCNVLCNGGFDNVVQATSTSLVLSIPCWSTNAVGGQMEVWANGFAGVPSYSGIQFVELNALSAATMFQTFGATANNLLSIGFAHRGRSGMDTVEVSIGPAGGPYVSLGRYGDGNTAWGYRTLFYTPPTSGPYTVRFTPTYWTGNNVAIGNFLDGVSVNGSSTYTINATSSTLCSGASATLSALGVTSYTWSTQSTASVIVVSPTITTTYSLNGYNGACAGSGSITITVAPNPTISVSGPTAACQGNSVGLTASGAQNYTWNPNNLNGAAINPVINSATVFSVVGTNSNNCSASANYTVGFNTTPVIGVSPQSSTICPGTVTTLTASGGATYTWLPSGANGSTFTLAPIINTTYTLTGASVQGCTATATASVFIKQTPTLLFNTFSITCASLGTATVYPAGGIGPFSYTWIPSAQTGSIANNLSPSTYTLRVFDAATGCATFSTTTFTSLVPLTGTLSNTPSITCNSASTGTASFSSIAGGSSSQTYSWFNGATTITTPSVNTLSAGNWSVTITDVLTGCQVFSVFTITQPPALTLNIAANTPTACVGYSIVLTGLTSGGTPGYTYTWTTGPASANTKTVSQSSGGAYIYTLSSRDSYNCLKSNTISVNFINRPLLAVSNVSICPFATGTLTASGATTYTWSNNTTGNTFTANPTINTEYSLTATALGCTAVASASIILKSVPVPTLTTNGPRCNGDKLLLNGSGGSFYVWTGPQAFSSSIQNPTINPVGVNNAGVYNLTVTAANNCTASTSSTLVVYPSPTLTASGSTVCTSGTITLNSNSNVGATYLWMGPLSFTSGLQNISIPNPLVTQGGSYSIVATSVNNCTNMVTVPVSVLATPTLNIARSSASICAQALNGSPNTINLNFSGALTYTLTTPSHISNVNPSGPSSPLSPNAPYVNTGAVTVTLQGSNGVCQVNNTGTFLIIPNPTVTLVSTPTVICYGQNVSYTTSGASSYTWFGANANNTLYINGNTVISYPLVSSMNSVFGTSLGCNSATENSNITVNPLPVLTVSPNPASVCLHSPIQLKAGGTGTSYTWSPSSWLNTNDAATVVATPHDLNNYSYTVTASLLNCTTTAVLSVSVLPLPVAIITTTADALCLNNDIKLTGSGGINYKWTGPSGYSVLTSTLSVKATALLYSGIYTLTVSGANNCLGVATKSITVYDLPQGYFNGQLKGCAPYCSDLTFVPNSTSSQINALAWQVNGLNFSGTNFSTCFNFPGEHKITGSLMDVNNCSNTLTTTVFAYSQPKADFSFYPPVPLENSDEVTFTDYSSGSSLKNWNWHFIKNGAFSSQEKKTSYLFQNAGIYPVALVVTNVWGCSDTIVKQIEIVTDFNVYIPSAFTPNDDNTNDIFIPVMNGVNKFSIEIFNRWGQSIFQSTNPLKGWDGKFKGEPSPDDIYAWRIQISGANGFKKDLSGHVTLYR